MRHYRVITIALLVGGAAGASAQLTVASTTPSRHSLASAAASVSVTFERALNTGTVTASTFRVFGPVQLRAGADGAAKMLLRGRGANLDMPDVGSLTGPIDVRLIRSGGAVCWGATYSAPFLKNDGVTLKDKAD